MSLGITATYDGTLSRVRLAVTGMDAPVGAVNAIVESSTDQIVWATVRGGGGLDATVGAATVDDYEFAADVVNYYRVTVYDADSLPLDSATDSITPTLTALWLKSITRPFLNRTADPRGFSPVRRPSKGATFEVVGRSFPVAVTDLPGGRRWTLQLISGDPDATADLELLLASGDVLLVQTPTTGALSTVPSGYVLVGDTSIETPDSHQPIVYITLDCTEVAAPGPDVVGATVTWQTVLDTYATWADLLADKATWADVLELVGDPGDVIVP